MVQFIRIGECVHVLERVPNLRSASEVYCTNAVRRFHDVWPLSSILAFRGRPHTSERNDMRPTLLQAPVGFGQMYLGILDRGTSTFNPNRHRLQQTQTHEQQLVSVSAPSLHNSKNIIPIRKHFQT